MRSHVVLIAALLGAAWTGPALGGVDCQAARCSVQAEIDRACPCDAAQTHGEYVRCVAGEVNRLALEGRLPRECKGKVKRCAARSICGKPGFVVCDLPAPCPDGSCTRCKISSSAERCTARGGTVAARTSCCAACPPSTSTPCGPTLSCDSATEMCVSHQPIGPAIVYECEGVPAGCESDRTCACTAPVFCQSPFDVCTDVGANAIDCACPQCQ